MNQPPSFQNIPSSWILRTEYNGIAIEFPSRAPVPTPPYEMFISYDGHIAHADNRCLAPAGKCWHVSILRAMLHKKARKPGHGVQDTSLSALRALDKARRIENCNKLLDLYNDGNWSDAEVEAKTGLPPNIVTARRDDLRRLGLVESKAYVDSVKSGLRVLSWGLSDFVNWKDVEASA